MRRAFFVACFFGVKQEKTGNFKGVAKRFKSVVLQSSCVVLFKPW